MNFRIWTHQRAANSARGFPDLETFALVTRYPSGWRMMALGFPSFPVTCPKPWFLTTIYLWTVYSSRFFSCGFLISFFPWVVIIFHVFLQSHKSFFLYFFCCLQFFFSHNFPCFSLPTGYPSCPYWVVRDHRGSWCWNSSSTGSQAPKDWSLGPNNSWRYRTLNGIMFIRAYYDTPLFFLLGLYIYIIIYVYIYIYSLEQCYRYHHIRWYPTHVLW